MATGVCVRRDKDSMNVTSAAGVISLLDEPEPQLKAFALNKLDRIVDTFWPEISENVEKIEMLYEDPQFKPNNELAALVVSKVYYHLGAFEESVTFALGAGNLFNVNDTSQFVETIIAKCIDQYTKLRVHNAEAAESDVKTIDPRLEKVVDRMFARCLEDKQYKQAVGIALETRRIDVFKQAIEAAEDVGAMLTYAFKVTMSLIPSLGFRTSVLRVLTSLYTGLPTPDYISVCQCYIFLGDAQAVADILVQLARGAREAGDTGLLTAYQIAFDLYESGTQQFLHKVQTALAAVAPAPLAPAADTKAAAAATAGESSSLQTGKEDMDTSEATAEAPAAAKAEDAPATPASPALSPADQALQSRLERLHTILGGSTSIFLRLQFLIKNNKSDLLILKTTKEAVRNSVCHSATVMANSLMHCGTTSDQFLRDNLEWLSRATNWAKFTATASLGVIHKGHEKEALNLMAQYLPKDMGPGSSYSEGGGLYALGLIHANHGGTMTDYLLGQLRDATSDMVRHGGCLGLGLAAMGSAREDIYEQLKFNLFQDEAVTGEAAGLAMGLVMLGTKSPTAVSDMVQYAQETQHEKILRGLAVGIALTMYGRLEEADPLIETLSRDKDPILRWSGLYTLAMAYCGSGDNQAIRKLLHVAVSDVNDDVRRVAVTCLGFLLFRTPEQCPSVVSLLSESYNPHVRFGAAMALGIACAGTGLKEAVALLEPMTNDPVNYVRQGALIASALVLVQHNAHTAPRVTHFRQLYAKVISDKHEDIMAKFGAILAQGIIDAGGRNATIGLLSRAGHTNTQAVVGMLVFCQHWFWYPLVHFLSLALKPAALITLNQDLKMPKLEFKSAAKPSTYAYPPPLEEKKDKIKEKVETAVLSTTAKHKKKEQEKKKDSQSTEAMDTSTPPAKPEEKKEADKKDSKEDADKDKADKDKADKEKTGEEKKEKEPEPNFEMLANPSRVMKAQLRVISLDPAGRYAPVKDLGHGGIIMLRNKKPGEEEELVAMVAAGGPRAAAQDEGDEPPPPEPFEWKDD